MGPLAGYRIVEFAGIGPAPMAAMLLADMGATVLRLDRPEQAADLGIEKPARFNLLNRGRETLKLDLKSPAGLQTALDLIGQADALIEGFRPGTMERIGLGPDICFARNPRLVYGRMTGWGQDGPLAPTAGHDLNYIALTGALHAIGRQGAAPTPPLNLVGDFGGGSLYLAFGMVCALLEAAKSGQGQVVDAAMVDGAASLMTSFYGLHAAGLLSDERGEIILDSGAPFYDCYECADGKFLAVAPIEKRFRAVMLERIGLDPACLPSLDDPAQWGKARTILAAHFRSRPRDAWMALLDGSDACVSPVLSLAEAPDHPHHRARGSFIEIDGVVQPAPAPRFSRTRPDRPTPPQTAPRSQDAILADWGLGRN